MPRRAKYAEIKISTSGFKALAARDAPTNEHVNKNPTKNAEKDKIFSSEFWSCHMKRSGTTQPTTSGGVKITVVRYDLGSPSTTDAAGAIHMYAIEDGTAQLAIPTTLA